MKRNYLLVFVLLLATTLVQAQVTIGSGSKPQTGALLDLKEYDDDIAKDGGRTAQRGLGLSRVKLEAIDKLTVSVTTDPADQDDENLAHTGLLVYNTEEKLEGDIPLCKGLQVWTGKRWQPLIPSIEGEIIREIPMSVTIRTINSSWDGSEGTAPKPLGQFLDIRGTGDKEEINVYEHALMYYEDVKTETWTEYYGVKASCDPDDSTTPMLWETEKIVSSRTNVPVIMMTENLNTRYAPTGKLLGVLGVVGNGYDKAGILFPNNIANGITTDYLLNIDISKTWTDGQGMLYNWAAATVGVDGVHGKGGEDGQQEFESETGEKEGLQVQGICPNGWHLPSEFELIQLESAMKIKVESFSNGGNSASMGNVWKSTLKLPLSEFATDGTSFSSYHGGFNILLAGRAYNNSHTAFYGEDGHLWSSSPADDKYAAVKSVNYDSVNIPSSIHLFDGGLNVRCKKDN